MTKIERQVMAAVGMVYFARQLTGSTALKLYICAASLWGIGQLVWVAKVFENVPENNFVELMSFFLSAAMNTNLFVQVMLAVLVLAGISLLLDLLRATPRRSFA